MRQSQQKREGFVAATVARMYSENLSSLPRLLPSMPPSQNILDFNNSTCPFMSHFVSVAMLQSEQERENDPFPIFLLNFVSWVPKHHFLFADSQKSAT